MDVRLRTFGHWQCAISSCCTLYSLISISLIDVIALALKSCERAGSFTLSSSWISLAISFDMAAADQIIINDLSEAGGLPSPFSFDPHTGETVSSFNWQQTQRELLAAQQQPPDDGSLFIGLDLSTQVGRSLASWVFIGQNARSVDIIPSSAFVSRRRSRLHSSTRRWMA